MTCRSSRVPARPSSPPGGELLHSRRLFPTASLPLSGSRDARCRPARLRPVRGHDPNRGSDAIRNASPRAHWRSRAGARQSPRKSGPWFQPTRAGAQEMGQREALAEGEIVAMGGSENPLQSIHILLQSLTDVREIPSPIPTLFSWWLPTVFLGVSEGRGRWFECFRVRQILCTDRGAGGSASCPEHAAPAHGSTTEAGGRIGRRGLGV